MQRFLLLSIVLLGLVGCYAAYAEYLEPEVISEDQSYISVTVMIANETASNGGCAPEGFIQGIEDAMITLEWMEEERPFPTETELQGMTDDKGRYLFEDLPAGTYRIHVDSREGKDMREVTTKLGTVRKVYICF